MKNRLTLCFSLILLVTGAQQQIYAQCVTCTGNTVTGIQSSALGDGNTVHGNYSFVAGRNSIIHSGNPHGNIIGSESVINGGFHSIVIGSNSSATNDFSFVFGPYSKSKGTLAFAIGSHVEAWSGGSFVIGGGLNDAKLINTIPNSLMIGLGSALPTLFVEKAPYSFESNRTGRIGIGNVTAPQAKLHIRADAEEDATLRLEATGDKKVSRILFSDEHFIQAVIGDNMFFNTQREMNFIFQNGNVGIGVTNNPQDKLDVQGSIRSSLGYKVGNRIIISSSRNLTVAGGVFENNISVQGTSSSAFNGSLGIGTISPREKLEVVGFIRTSSGYKVGTSIVINSDRDYSGGNGAFTGALSVTGSGNSYFNGNVAIGATTPGEYKLAVKGHIRAEEVVVELMDAWPDYVFETDYPLMRLDELQTFINENNHLPGVPNAQQISEEGISLGEMNALLLKKIEELTLYILKQEERISTLENVVNRENE